jgi:FMN phosphatase YigB (HAD superfamily)
VRPAAIFDMDGTLCDVSSIRFHVNPKHPKFSGRKRFDRFHGAAINCPPHQEAIDHYLWAREQEYAILIVSARKSFWALPTLLWLRENGVQHDKLYMRKNLDNRKDVVVKREILDEIRRDGYEPVFAVDDNPAIIEMWLAEDIACYVIPGWEE